MEGEIKWIKISVNMFSDDKIKQIRGMEDGDEIILIWLQLLLLAGRINQDGMLIMSGAEIPYTESMLARAFDMPDEIVEKAMAVFVEYAMVEIIDDVYHVANWAKHQAVEGMDKIREQTKERVKKFRKNQQATGKVKEKPDKTQLQLRFESFWKAYPKKVGKGAAERAFAKAKPDDTLTEKMISAVEAAKRSSMWRKEGGQYIPNPATWLNQKRWEDELPEEAQMMQPTLAERGLENWDGWNE
ncbi:MAG: phage replisome organizer N-terminal domain-containing protein [Acidaminococcaceae bacterium]|nr:phage replisome organizer N-terminal domain-containing protein [Acidaminococcaceae bacterium]